jgi:hypothetical protein
LLCVVSSAGHAQRFAFGAIGGIRASNDIVGLYGSESRRYVVGSAAEFDIGRGLAAEVNALYRRTGFRTSSSDVFGADETRHRGNTWEFPFLLKYRFPMSRVQPFVEAGYAPRWMFLYFRREGTRFVPETGQRVPFVQEGAFSTDVSHGFVVSGGVELRAGRLRISPGARYTRWGSDPINYYPRRGVGAGAALNQVDILLSITWR